MGVGGCKKRSSASGLRTAQRRRWREQAILRLREAPPREPQAREEGAQGAAPSRAEGNCQEAGDGDVTYRLFTQSGGTYDVEQLDLTTLSVDDIAVALSRLYRWRGEIPL